ncbi:unnamed protein product [Rhodiola kirilowii]
MQCSLIPTSVTPSASPFLGSTRRLGFAKKPSYSSSPIIQSEIYAARTTFGSVSNSIAELNQQFVKSIFIDFVKSHSLP